MSWFLCWAMLATVLAITGRAWGGDEKPDLSTARPMPAGGVADPTGAIGYWPNSTGGIDALELASGKVLWSSKDGHMPLIATNNQLMARANGPDKPNQFRIAVLDSKDGKRVLDSKPIELDDWVRVTVERGHWFTVASRLEANRLLLAWEARAWYDGGAEPSEEKEKAMRRKAVGLVRVDLRTGQVEKLKAETPPVPSEPATATVRDLVITVKLGAPTSTKAGIEVRTRSLQAADAVGKTVWSREIAPLTEFLPLK